MPPATPQGVIAAETRSLLPYKEAPELGDWLVCPSGHVLAQYVDKARTGLKDWGKFSGAVMDCQFGRRIISCAICGKIASTGTSQFSCKVVSDKAVKKAVKLI
ncbi:hypothetical protein [Roseibium album]|uniref:hypothetical protein n=1 Tax=Roseibium album TaxID=311410 RepID=UPI00391D2E9C